MSIIIAILIFSVIIIIHEFGHYIAAVKSGVLVEEFAIGMGPVLLKTQKGETQYSLRLFPIGGFCRMRGEDSESDDGRAFCQKKVSSRVIITAAGAVMNFILAIILLSIVTFMSGTELLEVGSVLDGYNAKEAGILPGDRITGLDGKTILTYYDFIIELSNKAGSPVEIRIKRDGETKIIPVTPKYNNEEQRYLVGFSPVIKAGTLNGDIGGARIGIFESIKSGFMDFLFYIKITFVSIAGLLTGLFTIKDMAGPIGIVQTIGTAYTQTSSQGFAYTFIYMANFTAIISANIGIFNLLPLPALDGGRLVFLLIEGIRRKPLNPNKEGMVHFVGLVLLMIFAVFVAISDIGKLL